ncbi:DUF4349 domain-containing protein [Aquimarina sp. MMG016]|uniref:DUF4349 domain-containing protein n=1 Tax=Aquimarina sp. MMG016 TaxID=2822690 RepID=UPI001B3A02AC|nr:DUF4349 domain-containing protein [Aquimarina sp. MMG016]MBQ4821534.1 DUF4349 domain-containing protein [Aquimarina sp. MMG016]
MKTNNLKLIKGLGIGFFILITFSCSRPESKYDISAEQISLQETGETPSLNSYKTQINESKPKKIGESVDLKIIRNANCKIKVRNVEKATSLAKRIASTNNGYVSDERFSNTNYTKENRFTIRIPQNRFDTVLDSICGLAEFVDHKNITTVDVTEEYLDIKARLKTKLEVKQRYETILRNRAKTVEDILKAEEKLSGLQEEIESAQGRLNYLGNRVAYSTIQLDMYESVIPKEEPSIYEPTYLDKATKGLTFGWSLVESVSLIMFYIWPFLLLGFMIYMYFRWIRKYLSK